MKKLSILILINIIFAQTSEKANVTIYKDGTALVKQEIVWNNIPTVSYTHLTLPTKA